VKPGDLVKVSKNTWNTIDHMGQIGMIIDVEMTPPYLGGDEMFVVLIGGTEQRFYDDELEVVDETR
jgi:hypothetical protein